ncbi:unnamed protein product [Adineta steineri]|uniref:G-protein coupled receptors family 1 profile domain-containing protein n=1 Tax=Adineta steineri TaxID=433720 RepID=A0A815AR94_9BILA|nr:unnamed protein product [Adineta steineri]
MVANIESWFIPFDVFMIICISLVVILAIIFFIIIIIDRACHTVPMMLIANLCLAEFLFGSDLLSMVIFTLRNDLYQIDHDDIFCNFRGYLSYVGYALQNYCFLLQSIYRYLTVIYPTDLFYQSTKFQCFLICLTWLFSFIYAVPFILMNQIKFNLDNQICQMPLGFSFFGIYTALCIYGIPISLIMMVYFKLVQYVKEMNKRAMATNILMRAERELKMLRRTVIIVLIIIIIGLPYGIFSFMAFFTNPPKYYIRIAFIFVDASLLIVMIALFNFTEPLKTSIIRRLNIRNNTVVIAIT